MLQSWATSGSWISAASMITRIRRFHHYITAGGPLYFPHDATVRRALYFADGGSFVKYCALNFRQRYISRELRHIVR